MATTDQSILSSANETPALIVNNIHKSFGEREVLRGISLTLKKGDVVSLLGASGSGKSTFLRCINLLEKPDQGEITINGEALKLTQGDRGLTASDPKQMRRLRTELGMVFQNFNLWSHMTVLENMVEAPIHVLGLSKKEAKEQALELLDKVGLSQHTKDYPISLSGGQQQRVAIARALAMNPSVMLFDEPTSALDPELVHEVLTVMQTLAKEGMTMLIVTHEMGFAKNISDEVVFFREGLVEEKGSPAVLFTQSRSEHFRRFIQHLA